MHSVSTSVSLWVIQVSPDVLLAKMEADAHPPPRGRVCGAARAYLDFKLSNGIKQVEFISRVPRRKSARNTSKVFSS